MSLLQKFPVYALTFLALAGCSPNPVAWWSKVNAKARELASLEARYHALEAEHEQLKKEHYRLENELSELRAKDERKDLAELNLKATGSATGRDPASIVYQVPSGLKPEEIQVLAYEHLKENRFGEAAVSFEEFLKSPEASALHDAKTLYSAGVAWYQVGNYKKAKERMESAKAYASGEQKEKIRKKVDLWMRVIDRRMGQEKDGGLEVAVDGHSGAPASSSAHAEPHGEKQGEKQGRERSLASEPAEEPALEPESPEAAAHHDAAPAAAHGGPKELPHDTKKPAGKDPGHGVAGHGHKEEPHADHGSHH